ALEALARRLPRLDLAHDALVAEQEREAAHRAVAGQRQQVLYVQRLVERVAEALGQDDPGDPAAGGGGQVHALERELAPLGGDEAAAARRGGARGGLRLGVRGHGQHGVPPAFTGSTREARGW